MKSAPFFTLLVLIPLAALCAPPAQADTPPNAWEAAKDPTARDAFALHATVREAISLDGSVTQLRTAALERARALLEDARVESGRDLRLRFDLGEVYEGLSHHERAIAVLKPALDEAPDHPAAVDALSALAYAYAKLDRSLEERDVYQKYLARITDERVRSTAILNMAEAEMRLGNLQQAVAGYREAFQQAATLPNSTGASHTAVLAIWGLAVALDRSGDPSGAAGQAKYAVELDPGERVIGDRRLVFFVPEYERFWYFGLAAVEHARQAGDARSAALAWGHAEALWMTYIARADTKDRWLRIARGHRDRAHNEKLAAEKRAKNAPFGATKSPTDEWPLRP